MTMLEEMGCEMAQGFLMGKPGPAALIGELLKPGAVRLTVDSPAL